MKIDWDEQELKIRVAKSDEEPDQEMDASDTHEFKKRNETAGQSYDCPSKNRVVAQIDADVLEWFKNNFPDYESKINDVLRRWMRHQA